MNRANDRNGVFVLCSSPFGGASIDLRDGRDVAQWCSRLAVSEGRLQVVVGKVGPMANAVHAYLSSKGYSS